MAEKRQILIELKKGSSIRKVSYALRVHRDIVRSVVDVANTHGWMHPDCAIPTEEDMQCVIEQKYQPVHLLDDYRDNIRGWRQDGYSGVVIQRREGLLENAKEIGPNTHAFCQQVFSDPYTDKLRPVRSLLSLVIKYDKQRFIDFVSLSLRVFVFNLLEVLKEVL